MKDKEKLRRFNYIGETIRSTLKRSKEHEYIDKLTPSSYLMVIVIVTQPHCDLN